MDQRQRRPVGRGDRGPEHRGVGLAARAGDHRLQGRPGVARRRCAGSTAYPTSTIPSASGAPWKPALPTGSPAVVVPEHPGDPGQVLGRLDHLPGPVAPRAHALRAREPGAQVDRGGTSGRRQVAGGQGGEGLRVELDDGDGHRAIMKRRRATRPGTPRPPCRAAFCSFLRCLVGSRSPKTVPRVWSVSCCRQRASRPSPENSTGSPSRPVPVTDATSGRAHARTRRGRTGSPRRPRRGCRSLPSGSVSTGLQTTPTVCSPDSSGQSKTKTARSTPIWQAARPDAVGGVHRRDHVGDQRPQLVVVRRDPLLRAVHDRRAPAGHRADGAALGERAVRAWAVLVGHGADRRSRHRGPPRQPL